MKDLIPMTGPRLAAAFFLLVGGVGFGGAAWADCAPTFDPMTGMTGWMGHPCPQPRPGASSQSSPDGGLTTVVNTPEGHLPAVDPFDTPPGSNFLMTVYENLKDFNGDEMPNTLPSRPENPYYLHDGPVLTRKINPTNPEDDLDAIIDRIEAAAKHGRRRIDDDLARRAIDIIEGNPIRDRAYSGFPLLHYNGPNKVKTVQPIHDEAGNVVGGNVDVNLIYYNQHIEGDTAFVDPSAVQEVPWTITYHVNILNRGMEDFSPMVMNFDRVGANRGPFHASMDQSYFPMLDEGTRYTVKIKETKGKYYNLTYIWGWRIHPPRVQVIENALKTAGPDGWTLPQWEKAAFCEGGINDPDCDPVNNRADREYAIAQIGDLSPVKRMWRVFKSLADERRSDAVDLKTAAEGLREAFLDWTDRTRLPSGVRSDPEATLTMLYVNNTIYAGRQGAQGEGSGLGPASYKGIGNGSALDWHLRPYEYKATIYNGDHFVHGYMNVDFGGSRGWENQFQYTDPTTLAGPHPEIPPGHDANFPPFTNPANIISGADKVFPINRGGAEEFLQPDPRNPADPVNGPPQLGSGCFFTFGRNYAWPNAGGPWGGIMVPPVATDGTPGLHKVEITYNFEPSPRLRIYQFDPLHHDVAVYSLH
ncbi:MAG: hypothetical protein GC138_05275 [Gammaproteobacteria bacterium]|nr:hypothetical protein [Gammaproteobacteria bacterium]